MVAADPSSVTSSDAATAAEALEAGNCLSSEELRRLYQPEPWRIARDTAATWAVILVGLAWAALVPHPLVYAVVFVVIGARQLALSHLVHDASHYNVSRNKARNDLVSDVFFATPILISTTSFRNVHQLHHSYLGEPERDTDVRAWYNIRGARFLTRSFMTLCGVEAAKASLTYTQQGSRDIPASLRHAALAAVTNLPLLAFCWWLDAPLVYFGLWLVPIFTVTVYLLALRVILEHQTVEYAALGHDEFERSFEPPLVRSIDAGRFERFILGSMNFCRHHEHHLFPGVPYSHLPELHRLLSERGYFESRPAVRAGSYAEVLRSLVSPKLESGAG